MPPIGLLKLATIDPELAPRLAALLRALGPLGWHVGQNLGIDTRYATAAPSGCPPRGGTSQSRIDVIWPQCSSSRSRPR